MSNIIVCKTNCDRVQNYEKSSCLLELNINTRVINFTSMHIVTISFTQICVTIQVGKDV